MTIPDAYVRIYTDDDGETHFEDVMVPGEERSSGVSSSRSLYGTPIDVQSAIFREVVQETDDADWHRAPRRQFVVHLAGHAQIEVSDGERRTVGPGDVVLVEDTTGKGHLTRSVGEVARRTLFVALPDDGY